MVEFFSCVWVMAVARREMGLNVKKKVRGQCKKGVCVLHKYLLRRLEYLFMAVVSCFRDVISCELVRRGVRPAAVAESSAYGHDSAVGPTSILGRGQFC